MNIPDNEKQQQHAMSIVPQEFNSKSQTFRTIIIYLFLMQQKFKIILTHKFILRNKRKPIHNSNKFKLS